MCSEVQTMEDLELFIYLLLDEICTEEDLAAAIGRAIACAWFWKKKSI